MAGPERNASIAAAALLAALLLQFALPPENDLPDFAPARRVGRPSAATLATRPTPPYPAVLSSDLFSPGRSGSGSEGGESSASPAADGPVVLGVAISPRGATAYLRSARGLTAARAGSSVDGWRVKAVARDAVILTRGATRRRVVLGSASSPSTDPAATAAAGDAR